MLPEIAAEALNFLSRRDLDKACGVNKWLDALISHCCEVYPLRRVLEVALCPDGSGSKLNVRTAKNDLGTAYTTYSFSTMGEGVHFAASTLRNSYVEFLQLGNFLSKMTLSRDHWTTLFDNNRGGAVECLVFFRVDLSALGADVFLAAVHSRGLRSLEIRRGIGIPNGFTTNHLIRSTVANVTHEPSSVNKSDAPCTLSEMVVLDTFLRTDAASRPAPESLSLVLDYGVTEMFLARFFERLRSSPFRHFGSVNVYGLTAKRGLSAFAQYLAPGDAGWADAIYRIPSSDDDDKSFYEIEYRESTSHLRMLYRLVCGSS